MGREHAERIDRLREQMARRGVDYYIIPTSDCHNSEYVGEHFKVREYLSGFTGSSGTLLIMRKEALLWTDGRYFIQAEGELAGSGIRLMKMGEEGVPTLTQYLRECVTEGQCIGFDGHVVVCLLGRKLEKLAGEKKASIQYEEDLADSLWEERPPLPCGEVIALGEELTGQATAEKLAAVRGKMKTYGADVHILTKLDDVMWLFNLRGCDIPCNPVALSYAVLTQEKAHLFLQKGALTDVVRMNLAGCEVTLEEYGDFEQVCAGILKQETDRAGGTQPAVLLDEEETGYALFRMLSERARVIRKENPTLALKAVKNETELAHMRKVYLRDSVCVIRFIRHIKEAVGKRENDGGKQEEMPFTEMYAADYIDRLRRQEEGFLDLSFETISAYKENAAMMHYTAGEKSDKRLEPEGFLLVDSGGQYLGGTTDVTRTVALGPLTDEQRRDFTLVAAGMLRLMNVVFLHGCTGRNLDIIARQPLWNIGRDYKCSTGHGVGYMLNVHEGPQRIGFTCRREAAEACLEEGMVVSDEPGVYVEGKYGIRTENILVCRKAEKTADGQFLCFEPLTYAPIDLDAIDPAYLTDEDKLFLNTYHYAVYEMVSPYLDEQEREWLRYQTREI